MDARELGLKAGMEKVASYAVMRQGDIDLSKIRKTHPDARYSMMVTPQGHRVGMLMKSKDEMNMMMARAAKRGWKPAPLGAKTAGVTINADAARAAVEAVKLMSPAMISGALTGAMMASIRNRGNPEEAVKGALLGGTIGGLVGTGAAMGTAMDPRHFVEVQSSIGSLAGGFSAFLPSKKGFNGGQG